MRFYSTLREAALEIRRDLSKGLRVNSTRVQNKLSKVMTTETSNYAYALPYDALDIDAEELVDLGTELFQDWAIHAEALTDWLTEESIARTIGDTYEPPDLLHPELRKYVEGSHYSYTYAERLQSWKENMVRCFVRNPDTRRAYWPIFQPLDSIRASQLTRVPCTLGFHWMIRDIPDLGYQVLEGTLIQRSVDFEKYWLSDLWLFGCLTHELLSHLNTYEEQFNNLVGGNINHYIISFHRFDKEGEEIY